jgi:hydrogenase nickel incorporation protein HypA/HybF
VHELPVTQSLLTVVLDAAQQHGASRVRAIDLVVGDLASIVDDSVQFYFDLLSRDTPAAGATLNFRRVPAVVTCADCGHSAQTSLPLPEACPACGGRRLQVSGGREFYVESIEVDDEGDDRARNPGRE